jgi:hypothetical protein
MPILLIFTLSDTTEVVIDAEKEAEEAEKEAEEAEKEAEREAEEAKEREKAESKERVKEAARQVALVMQRMWRAECRRCIGDGVGLTPIPSTPVNAGVGMGMGVGSKRSGETGHASSSSGSSSSGNSNCSQGNSSERHRQHPTHPFLGGYSVLGRTLEGWETFVLQGSDTLKRYVAVNYLSPMSSLISLLSSSAPLYSTLLYHPHLLSFLSPPYLLS